MVMQSSNTTQPAGDPSRCPVCGTPLTAGSCTRCQGQKIFRFFRREIVLLVVVAAGSVLLYLFTREVAIRNREMKARAAAYWYQRGQQQLREGQSEAAAVSFHRATVNNRESFQYGLALALALATGGRDDEARRALLRLRDAAPEHSEINLQLARLAARRGDVDGAVHYYRNALYGVWPQGSVELPRREVRMELIQFLLERGERNLALSELLLLSSELPEDAAGYTEVAELFLQADDPRQALAHFQKSMALDRQNAVALAGAGKAEFELGDYISARRYLQAAVARDPESGTPQELLEITRLILSRDPLEPRLSLAERHRRLIANFDYVLQRLEGCLGPRTTDGSSALSDLWTLHREATAMQPKMRPGQLRRDPELLGEGMSLVYRVLQGVSRSCGGLSSLDQALLRIGERHGGSEA